jgi:hypothetical protein
MNRLRLWSAVFSSLVAAAAAVAQPAEDKWLFDRAITATPAAAPAESLRYRLFPLASERKDGNAVPIYLRLIHEQNDESRRYWTETPKKWNDLPVDQLPKNEVREFLDRMGRFYQQFDYGARRRTADWGYTLEQPNPVNLLLPDVAVMRGYVPMLALRARVLTAEGDYDAAARAFATGLGFSRHVGEAPLLISGLVGISCSTMLLDRLPEWVEKPGSPNLYWSLTALPHPLIDLRPGMELEQRVLEMEFPDFRDLDRPRSAAEWDATLKRFREKVKYMVPLVKGDEAIEVTDPNEPASKSPELAAARKYLAGRTKVNAASAPDAQVLLLYIYGSLCEHRDTLFRATYLPYAQARPLVAAAAGRLKAAPATEPVRVSRMFLPAVPNVGMAQNRLERRIALLRVVEALRLHAAANGGKLPATLSDVKEVPVPTDSGTGQPFEYRLDGDTATVSSRIPGEPLEKTGLRVRLTMQAK